VSLVPVLLLAAAASATALEHPDPSRCATFDGVALPRDGFRNAGVHARQIETCQLAKQPPFVRREGATLFVELAGGRVLELVDGKSLARVELPKARSLGAVDSWVFREYVPRADAVVVAVLYYEDEGWLVIRRRDGAVFELAETPWFSPSGKTLLTAGGWGGSWRATFWTDLDAVPRIERSIDVGYSPGRGVVSNLHLAGGSRRVEPVRWRDEDTIEVAILDSLVCDGKPVHRSNPALFVRAPGGFRLESTAVDPDLLVPRCAPLVPQ
jgi:hypothetical protein